MNPPPGIEALPNGQWIVDGDTHFAVWSRAKGTIVTDTPLLKWLTPFLEDCRVVWDLGACIGDHTRFYLDQGFQVVAVEAHPITFQCLVQNCPEATCLNIAASDKAGSLNFTSLDNVGASRIHPDGEWQIPANAMDDIPGLPAPDFIKVDVEGHEPQAIRGMADTITRHRPILFVEFNKGALEANGATPESLHEMILALGYSDWRPYPAKADFSWPQFDILYLP